MSVTVGTEADAAPEGDDDYVILAEDPPMAEEVQALGHEGVLIIKRWLESTTHIELSYDVYDFTPFCIVPYIGGKKRFDLAGRYMSGDKAPVYVECKRYRTAGGQAAEFDQFLRIAYSSTLSEIQYRGRDLGTRFIWVTYHPFSQKKWATLETHENMRRALLAEPTFLGNTQIDEERLRDMASRVMVLVFNPKQEALSLTTEEVKQVRTILDRS